MSGPTLAFISEGRTVRWRALAAQRLDRTQLYELGASTRIEAGGEAKKQIVVDRCRLMAEGKAKAPEEGGSYRARCCAKPRPARVCKTALGRTARSRPLELTDDCRYPLPLSHARRQRATRSRRLLRTQMTARYEGLPMSETANAMEGATLVIIPFSHTYTHLGLC